MEFTTDEKEFAEKYVQNLERYARQWVPIRTILMLLVVVILGTSIYGYKKIQHYDEFITATFNSIKSDKVATYDDLISHSKFYANHSYFIMFGQLLLALCLFSGFFLIVIIISEWNRHKKNLLLVKFIKTVIHNQKGKNA